ncbi:MAG TPA: hypothetical protein VN901_03065 [Candidatus Acidoferrales bacterium]|nr:hypothetical protein [Candidatus Acidoferrales bacterium]
MTPRKARYSRYGMQIAAAALISTCCLQPVSAGQTTDVAVDAEAAARDNWRAVMAHNTDLWEGCFQASYPSTVWEEVDCRELHPRVPPVFHKPGEGQVTGNGHDYVAQAPGLISGTLGTFPKVTGVKSEKSVGVAAFGDGGILGPNEYSLQVNTNLTGTTSACDGHAGCVVWQQFIYATDYETEGKAAVFMQYWLIGWGDSDCPRGFDSDGEGDCFGNSKSVAAPDVKATSLGKLSLSGAAEAGSKDTVVFTDGTTAYSVSGSDSVLDISKVWHQSEFNVVGDAGGSRADFNTPVSITMKVALTDGSTSAPTCVANAGTTGETNNLNLGSCSRKSGAKPFIEFTQSN